MINILNIQEMGTNDFSNNSKFHFWYLPLILGIHDTGCLPQKL
jgi:hypothetical protein